MAFDEEMNLRIDLRGYEIVQNIDLEGVCRPVTARKGRRRGRPSLKELLAFLGGLSRL